MLSLLRQRNFALLWVGGLVSIAGDWVMYAALPYFVYQQTGSTLATAGMIAAELAPSILLGSVAGVFVDRWDRKRVLVVTNLLQAAAVSTLFLVPLNGWLWLVYVAAAAASVLSSFSVPAEGALLPTLVDDEQLVPANALNVLNNRIGRLTGLPLGAFLLGALGLEGVVLVDCASFLLAAALIAPIDVPPSAGAAQGQPAGVPESPGADISDDATDATSAAASAWKAFWGEWLAGLRIVRHDKTIAVVFFVLGLMTFGGTMLDPLTVAWVRDILGGGVHMYALLMTVHAASGIVGSLLVGAVGKRMTPRALMGWAGVIAGVVTMIRYNVPLVPVALVTSASAGLTNVISSVGVETLVQRSVPDAYRGRVYGALGASGGLLSLLGAVLAGAMAEVVGLVTMLNVAAGLILLAGVVVLWAFRGQQSVSAEVSIPEQGEPSPVRS